jgi:excisionase family DNA binding protein
MSVADQIERIGHVLTAAELAKLLRVSRVTVFRLAAAGRLPSVKVGTCVRFDPRRGCDLASGWKVRCSCVAKRAIIPGDLSENMSRSEAKVSAIDALWNPTIVYYSIVALPV